jgi:hypothetical protein
MNSCVREVPTASASGDELEGIQPSSRGRQLIEPASAGQ